MNAHILLNLPAMEGWAPEALGAFVGALSAGAIAFWVTRTQIHAEKTHALEATRRAAFGEMMLALDEMGESLSWGRNELRTAYLRTVSKQQVWSMYLSSEDKEVGDWVYEMLHRIVSRMAEIVDADPDGKGGRERAFFVESKEAKLFDGLHNHGFEWHREGGDMKGARDWFEANGAEPTSSPATE